MDTATRGRPSTASPADGSRTLTITDDPTREEGEDDQDNNQAGVQSVGTLKLRGGPKEKRTQRVAWNDDVVDNEFFGKKKSKSMSGNFCRFLKDVL
jgi:protein phosphatase 1 regulatory subunit 11